MPATHDTVPRGPVIRLQSAVTPTPAPRRVWLTVKDVEGSYAIPYIQSAPDLTVRLEFADAVAATATVSLCRDDDTPVATAEASPASPLVSFAGLVPAEYSIRIIGRDRHGGGVVDERHGPIGVGTVIAALGDSITEGYHSQGFWRDDLELTPDAFPPEVASADRRNYPQYAPTTHVHRPDVNCFTSWMPRLNDLLAAAWRRPVFIANEGWGGATTAAYLKLTRDAGWQDRMRLLRPTVWLIHLGVNDERHKVAVGEFAANLAALVEVLLSAYTAVPARIFISTPCYDYWPKAAPVLQAYRQAIADLIAARGLRTGPDFLTAYAVDKERLYGTDPVHPNLAGMALMAELWAAALTGETAGPASAPLNGRSVPNRR